MINENEIYIFGGNNNFNGEKVTIIEDEIKKCIL
jgi:hypothetical protein